MRCEVSASLFLLNRHTKLPPYGRAGEGLLFKFHSVLEGVAHLSAYNKIVVVYRVEHNRAQLGRVNLALFVQYALVGRYVHDAAYEVARVRVV